VCCVLGSFLELAEVGVGVDFVFVFMLCCWRSEMDILGLDSGYKTIDRISNICN
jgi:hypothetical protein